MNPSLAIFLCALIGSGLAATTLEEDFKEFEALIPQEQIRDIALKYLATDPEFKAAVVYLKGPEFAALVKEVGEKEAVKEFEEYLIDAGIDIKAFLDYIHNLIAGAEPAFRFEQRSLKGFFEEVKKTLPIGKIISLYMDKMKNSPAFQQFFMRITAEDFHQLVEEVRALPEVQRLNGKLQELGIEIERYLNIIYAIFGWN